jgi:hypothetical protein
MPSVAVIAGSYRVATDRAAEAVPLTIIVSEEISTIHIYLDVTACAVRIDVRGVGSPTQNGRNMKTGQMST